MKNISVESQFLLLTSQFSAKVARRAGMKLSFHGISFPEFQLMHYVALRGGHGVPRIELAEHMGMSASGVTRMLAPMEKIGLVEREKNARDARQSLVRLTDAGATIHSDACLSMDEAAKDICKQFDAKEIKNLVSLYRKIL